MQVTLIGGTQEEGARVLSAVRDAFGGQAKIRVTMHRSGPGWVIQGAAAEPPTHVSLDDIATALTKAGITIVEE